MKENDEPKPNPLPFNVNINDNVVEAKYKVSVTIWDNNMNIIKNYAVFFATLEKATKYKTLTKAQHDRKHWISNIEISKLNAGSKGKFMSKAAKRILRRRK
jgi:deoxyxylulose-5-phosphate synthase